MSKKKFMSLLALLVFAVLAAVCVFGFTACSDDDDDNTTVPGDITTDDTTDDTDAADITGLFDALVKTCSYEGSFTVTINGTYSADALETDGDETYYYPAEGTILCVYAYDAKTGNVVHWDDEDEYFSEDDVSYVWNYSRHVSYVPNDDGKLSLYTYCYDAVFLCDLSDGEKEEYRKVSKVESSDYLYTWYTDIRYATDLDLYFDEDEPWTSVDDMSRWMARLGEVTDVEINKDAEDTVYKISVVDRDDEDEDDWFVGTYVYEFYVNPDGYIYKYSVSGKEEEGENDQWGSFSETYTETNVYEILYDFDENYLLSEDEMALYEED